MIQQQIRPWLVSDEAVLDLLERVRRDAFVPPHLAALAYCDVEIPLNLDGVVTGEYMLAPKIEAHFLQALALHPHETVLQVGTGSGYLAALMAHKAEQVISVEIDPRIRAFAEGNLRRAGIHNVRLESGNGLLGVPESAPYDAVVVGGSVPLLPEALLAQVKPGGRLVAIVGTAPVMQAQLVRRSLDGEFSTTPLFETVAQPLQHAPAVSAFHF